MVNLILSIIGVVTKIPSLLRGNQVLLIAVLVAFAAGGTGGWWVKSKFADASDKAQYESALEYQIEQTQMAKEQAERVRLADEKAIRHLQLQLKWSQHMLKPIYVEVPKYAEKVSSNVACNVPAGVVGVLSAARAGKPQDMPEATSITDAEGQAASSIPAGIEYQAHAECGVYYNELKAKNDALIDWINENYTEN